MKKVKLFFIPAALLALPLLMTPPPALADTTNLSVTLDPVLSIRVVKAGSDINTLTLNVEPTASGRFIKDDLSVLVSTSNETGYTLTMSGNDADTAMHHTESTITATIPSITASADESSFPINSWAYSLGDISSSTQQFSPIPLPTSSATIKTTTAPTTEDSTNVTFAAKLNTAIPAGTYQDTIVFSATTNYVPNNLERITNMQDMTPAVCKSANIGDTATLKDTRDNKTYTIRKLADGNCWMIKNLDLDLSTTTTLTNQDTNLKSKISWTPQNSTQTTEGTAWAQDGGDVARSMDPGNIYFPNGVGTGTADANANLEGTTTGEPWEFIGNYYNWYAATAGTGTAAMTSGNATDSICPKGWKLPDDAGSKSFANLLSTYSIADNNTGATELLQAPLNFVRSGYYRWVNGQIYVKGANGHWWSTSATSATNTHYFFTDNASVKPHNSDVKGQGLSVRCVAEGTLDSISTMQDMTTNICAAAVTGETAILTDTRNSKSYMIRKLADNNCWMVQNLALGGTSPITLTPTDSNVSTNFTLSASSNSFGITNDAAGIDINRMHDNSNTWLTPTVQGSNSTVNTTGTPPSQTQYMGNYYNWYTATAGSGTYAMGTQGDNALQSICPKGWRLPTGGVITSAGNSEFQKLYDAYDNYNDFIAATSAALSGLWNISSVRVQGSNGYWWSRTARNATDGFFLHFDISNVYPQDIGGKKDGFSIRCIAQ